jgi:UDP-N-acetylmuramoylalanine--D-glutamate ligase
MNIAIVGYDREGRASHAYYAAKGDDVSIFDANASLELPENTAGVVGAGYLQTVKNYDMVLRTPGLYPGKLIDAGVEPDKIWSGTNEFFNVCPTKNIIGVTGTKGKGTTSSLITKMLQNAGKRVHLGGNIGTPALDMLKNDIQPDDWVVLELSNFQLIDLQSSPHISVCLLIVPEHLDWHKDITEYVEAKKNIFAHQKPDDFAVYFANNENSKAIAQSSAGTKIAYYSPEGAHVEDGAIVIDNNEICKTPEIALLGEHNWQNVCAAVTAVWNITQDTVAIKKAITEFTGLEHRIEYVRTLNGVKFYNDSFATGLHATVAALNAIKEPKIAIIGGYDRMLEIDHFSDFLHNEAKNIKHILLIGQSKDRVAAMLTSANVTNYSICNATTIEGVVADAVQQAKEGDAIVFSPGFASFDMFKNFEERGLAYKKTVNAL